MSKGMFEGKRKEIRGGTNPWWGKLTYADLDQADGKYDALAGLLQQKYGYSRQEAFDEINQHLTRFEAGLKKKTVPGSAK